MPYPQGTPVPWPTPWATPSSTTSCHRGDAFSCEAEAAMLPMINELRAQRRKSAVSLHPGLSYVSREWSRAQMNRGDIGHEGFPSQRAGAYRSEFGSLDISLTAENVAMNGSGSSAQRAAAALFNQWKNSSGHLENMLGNHTYVGIGVVVNGRSVWGTQIFAVPRR